MSYYNSEEEFLSAYISVKLAQGGEPAVSREELNIVRQKFLQSVYCSNNIRESLKNLNFDDLELISKKFQQKASVNRSWLKPCFIYQNERLVPTYSYFDFTQTTYGEFVSFLSDKRFQPFEISAVNKPTTAINKKHFKPAQIVAGYLTKVFAERYIKKEVQSGRWPNHMTDLSNLFKKDLGKTLGLTGTKQYFKQFYKHAFISTAVLLEQNNGSLVLSDKKQRNLKYNNLKRILNGYPSLEKTCSAYYDKDENKFDITIDNGIVKCNESTLVFHDPYGNFSDEYSSKDITLK